MMKLKTMTIILMFLFILTIGAVSASEDINETLTFSSDDVQKASSLDDNAEVLGQVITNDDNLNESSQKGSDVLGSGLTGDEITINANTNTIDATNGNTMIVTVRLPKGNDAYLDISGQDIPGLDTKLSKIASKTTKNGFTTYTVYLKDLAEYENICDGLVDKGEFSVSLKYYNINEKGYDWKANQYLIKVNKVAKTFVLKKKIQTDIWKGLYDCKSGKTKKLTIHLERWPSGKPVVGKKVKITIYGVVYIKKTNSKGLVKIYPPKYLPPNDELPVRMEFAGDDVYTSCLTINGIQIYKNPKMSKSNIKAGTKTFNVKDSKKYAVKLLSKGKPIKKAKVKLTVDGKSYNVKTNSKGQATFDLSKLTSAGKFTGTIVYMGDKTHYMSYKNVKLSVI